MSDSSQKKNLRKRDAKRKIDNAFLDHSDNKKIVSPKSKKRRSLKQQKIDNENVQGKFYNNL